MNEKINIDNLIKDTVREDGLETPSNGFLDNVMSAVVSTDVKPLSYKPLISKYVLAAIFAGVILIAFFVYGIGHQTVGNYPFIDHLFNGLPTFHFSLELPDHISYIISSASIMLMIQAVLIGGLYKKLHR